MSQSEYITIYVACSIYRGFKYTIPLEFSKVDPVSLTADLKKYMKNFFQTANLIILAEGIDKLNLHIDPIQEGETTIFAYEKTVSVEEAHVSSILDSEWEKI